MKKCAYCGRENEENAVACFECGTDLQQPDVSEIDQSLQDQSLSLVIVATFRTVVDASLAKLRLESAGIEACIPEEYTPQIFWNVIPSPLESVTLRVAAKDYETARKVLAADA